VENEVHVAAVFRQGLRGHLEIRAARLLDQFADDGVVGGFLRQYVLMYT